MSILDSALFDDLFGPTRPDAVPPAERQPMKKEQETLSPIKKNEHMNIFSYRPEVLKSILYTFLDKLDKSGATYSVNEDRRVRISCKDFVLQEQLMIELLNNPELEALLILKVAQNNKYLTCCIEERASIRWGERLSDSLFLAVLCNLIIINETPSKGKEQPRTDWKKELEQLGFVD